MGLWFEEFKVDAVIDHAGVLEITQEDNAAFCKLTRNNQPLHLDEEAARAAGFDGILVNGLYTFSASVGMSVADLTEGTLIANMGYEDVRHPRPVHPGDTIHVRSTIVEKRTSSKPGRGVVRIGHAVLNQRGEVVCAYNRTVLVKCRESS